MSCTVCGAPLESITTDLPFKVSDTTIVIFKGLPVLQCRNCPDYLLEDSVLARVDEILTHVDREAEVEIIPYAA